MITVFGSNGNTGSVVAKLLLAAGKQVRVVGRSPDKVAGLIAAGAEFLPGDVLDQASVASALKGAEAAYLLLPPDPTSTAFVERGKRIAANYVAALRSSNVGHVAFLSSVGAQLTGGTGPIVTAHHAEQAFRAAGLATKFTFVRAAYFMENLLAYAHPMKTDGVLPVFGGGEAYPFPMVATADIGATAAAALLTMPAGNEIVELEGPAPQSFADAAAIASKVLGRPVKAVAVPLDGLVPALKGLGISDDVAKLYREMTEAFGSGKVGFEGGAARHVRGTTTLATLFGKALA